MQQRLVGYKSMAGTVLIGLGIFVLYENLHHVATQFSHLAGAIPKDALGLFPTVILAASRVLQAYGADYHRFLQDCLLHIVVSSWPLLLVVAGTVLSRECSNDNDALPKKSCRPVDLTAGPSTSE